MSDNELEVDEEVDVPDILFRGSNNEIIEEILMAKQGEPSKFKSFWELDDEVDEATEQEIQNNPVLKMLWAAENNKKEVVEELYKEDASLICAKDDDGYSPLHRASYNGHTDMVKVLLALGADIHSRTEDGWQPIHSACHWNQTEVVSLLLQNGANINSQTNGGQTPLHLAVSEKNTRNTVELLLMNSYINTDLKNNVNETAREICRRISDLYNLFEIREKSLTSLDGT